MQPTSKFRTGIKFGIITFLVYFLLLFIRYRVFGNSPVKFYGFGSLFYLIVLAFYLFAGIARKRELNGYATFKDIFQTIFVSILITELAFVFFNWVYVQYIDPSFWDNFKVGARTFFEKALKKDDEVDKQMAMLDEQIHQFSNLGGLLKGYGMFVILDSIIGMIYAAILRKKKEVFPETDL